MKVLYEGAVWRAKANQTELKLNDLFCPCRLSWYKRSRMSCQVAGGHERFLWCINVLWRSKKRKLVADLINYFFMVTFARPSFLILLGTLVQFFSLGLLNWTVPAICSSNFSSTAVDQFRMVVFAEVKSWPMNTLKKDLIRHWQFNEWMHSDYGRLPE